MYYFFGDMHFLCRRTVYDENVGGNDKCLFGWQMRRKISFYLQLVIFIIFWSVIYAHADQTIVAGGGSVRQEYDSNIYRTNSDRVSEWTTVASPTMSISDIGQRHSFSLQYTPSVVYSHLKDRERWDHWLSTILKKDLSEEVSSYIKDTFVRAEDPYNDKESGIELYDSRGRNRYWTNNLMVGLGHDYAKESSVNISYVNMILENDDNTYDDFVKHSPGVSIAHLFSQYWQAKVDYFYTKGNFDQDDDLENHAGDVYIYFRPSSDVKMFGHGGYTVNLYDGLEDDYDVTRASLGFNKQVSATFDYGLEGGVVSLNHDIGEDQQAFYYLLAVNKNLQYGDISLTGEGGIDEQQFNSNAGGDVSRYWQVQTDFSYNMTQDLLSSVRCFYREDTYWDRNPEEQEEKLQAEASISYIFGRWYMATVRYAYSRQESDILARCYDDNRLFLELSFNKEFFRW